MKKISAFLVCILMFTLVGCGSQAKTATVAPTKAPIKVTAQSIADKLKATEGRYMTDIAVIGDSNDKSNLLGRPNQYTEKITWNDNRAKDTQVDCSIELFANKEDAATRKAYLEGINKSFPMLIQYMTQKDNVLLRIDGTITPTQAKEYSDIFNK